MGEEMMQDGASEFYDLGIINDGKIENTDKGVVYELGEVFACIIRDYLRLYNKINVGGAVSYRLQESFIPPLRKSW